jgi:glycosyltransferase involved in cell wall biosynthesis
MKVDVEAFIICWNEEDIILHTLNHYASFCRRITLIDNQSTDDTIDLVRENFPETIIETFDSNNEIRDDLYLNIKNSCWKESTMDYVIVCDTDEFLFADNMVEQLARAKANKVVMPVVSGYDMGASQFPRNYQAPIYQQVTHGVRSRNYDKQIIFNPREVAEINFTAGAHTCNPEFRGTNLVDNIVEFKLLHFKYLGKEYLYKKHEAYAKRLSALNISLNFGSHYLGGREHVDECFASIDTHLYKVVC